MNFRKITTSMTSFFLASACILGTAWAVEYRSVAKDKVNLRSAPDTKSEVLFELPAGYPLKVLSTEGQWLKVEDFEGDKGWIASTVVNKTPYVIVTARECNIRSGPGTTDKIIGSTVRETIFSKIDQKGDWIKVSHPNLTGWVHKSLVWPQ